jgi:DNA-binding transcriptional ArsR family regulator
MLAFVPVVFDAYRPLKPRLRWAMACLVFFADRTGRCFPSVRKLAAFAGLSKSAVSRHLRDLVECGAITRQRRPSGVYEYEIDPRFLPRAPVSHPRAEGVPPARREEQEQAGKKTGYAQARFAERKVSVGEMPDENAKWQARLRSWRQSRFWLPLWGPKPSEPGCFAPPAVLQNVM